MIKTDILIIGAGPAACAAAVYTLRAGLKTIMLGGANLGGQLLQTNDIENYPGFIDPISGFEIMDKMHKQCKRLGAEILGETKRSAVRGFKRDNSHGRGCALVGRQRRRRV